MNDERSIIEGCLKGHQKSQKMLFDKYASKMMTVCLRYAKNREQAEDVLQEGFVKLFRSLGQFKFEGSFEGWMRRIFVNTALDAIRKEYKFSEDKSIDEYAIQLSSDQVTALEQLEASDLMELIQRMPPGYKLVFNMFAIEGYSHKEISLEMGISENTSKSQFSRARAYLREELEKMGYGK